MASKQLKKAIEKVRTKVTPVARYCEVCKKETINCAHKADEKGRTLYCICPSCLVSGMDEKAVRARRLINQK